MRWFGFTVMVAAILAGLAAEAKPTKTVEHGPIVGWAMVDRLTGRVVGSANSGTATNTMESMIKPWIAADYLRRLAHENQQPSQQVLDELELTIVDSHDGFAEKYYQRGGGDAVVRRMVGLCGLTSTVISPGSWSQVR